MTDAVDSLQISIEKSKELLSKAENSPIVGSSGVEVEDISRKWKPFRKGCRIPLKSADYLKFLLSLSLYSF